MFKFYDFTHLQCTHTHTYTCNSSFYWLYWKTSLHISQLIITSYLFYLYLRSAKQSICKAPITRSACLHIACAQACMYMDMQYKDFEVVGSEECVYKASDDAHKSKFHFNVLTKDQIKHFNWRFYGGRQPNLCPSLAHTHTRTHIHTSAAYLIAWRLTLFVSRSVCMQKSSCKRWCA